MSARTLVGAALAATALLTAGCGAVTRVTSGNPATGKALFVQKCGSCHTLADAKTQGTIGPNLDDAFASDKQQGFDISTIADVVRGQIAYPDTKPSTGLPGMTPNLLHGQQARDVAVYVAQCSAKPSCAVENKTVEIPG